ncbi:carnitine O-acetyltransferase yat1, partial [Linderina pennispora]
MPSSNFADIAASLPRLPVPDLADTASRFAAVAKPLFSTQEYEACMAKFAHFMANEAPVLQARLHERSTQHVNWLED